MDEICPLCLAGRGDQRHVCLTCQFGELPKVRRVLWDEVEEVLARNPGEVPWERKRTRGLRHPAGATGVTPEGDEERWPTVAALKWPLPTTKDDEIARGVAEGKPAERGHDLGYRGVVPQGIAKALGGPRSKPVWEIVNYIAEATGVMRAMYMKGVKEYVKQARAAVGQNQQEDQEAAEE